MKSCVIATVVVAMLVMTASCASQGGVADPALIEAEIAKSRAEELELVRATIRDPDRAETFIRLLEERDRMLERFSDLHADHKRKVAELSADYSAERGDFEALLGAFNQSRRSAQTELIELFSRMKQATSADEWRTISAFQVKRVDPRQVAFRDRPGDG